MGCKMEVEKVDSQIIEQEQEFNQSYQNDIYQSQRDYQLIIQKQYFCLFIGYNQLTEIYLNTKRNSSLGEGDSDQICQLILQNQKIKYLQLILFKSEFTKQDFISICQSISMLKNLTELIIDVSNSDSNIDSLNSLSQVFEKCTNLTTFEIFAAFKQIMQNLYRSCIIDQQSFQEFNQSISRAKKLEILSIFINNNSFSKDIILELANSISNCSQLKKLTLGMELVLLDEEMFKSICHAIAYLKKLEGLSFYYNDNQFISISSIKLLGQILSQTQSLTHLKLDLGRNEIEDNQIDSFGNQLQNCKNLKVLNLCLQENKISPQGFLFLGNSISHLANLKELILNLSKNLLDERNLDKFGLSLVQCANLINIEIDFQQNWIDNFGAIHLTEQFKKLQFLQTLSLNFRKNIVDNSAFNQIRKSLKKSKRLAEVFLYKN